MVPNLNERPRFHRSSLAVEISVDLSTKGLGWSNSLVSWIGPRGYKSEQSSSLCSGAVGRPRRAVTTNGDEALPSIKSVAQKVEDMSPLATSAEAIQRLIPQQLALT
jgi:hypothetical protein